MEAMKNSEEFRVQNIFNHCFFVMIFCLLYWIYLYFHTQMSIVFDAETYEKLGTMIYREGWIRFFETGPHNEPLFPFVISLSMRLGNIFSTHYQSIQKIFQIFSLLSTQALTHQLLSRLGIRSFIKTAVVLYLGISPALVNSTFSLWSEILTYPFVLGIILTGINTRKIIMGNSWKQVALVALLFGTLFAGITFVKAIFQPIFFILIFLCTVFTFSAFLKRNKKAFRNSIVFIFLAVVSYHLYVLPYMYVNLRFNNHFAIADRGPWIIYAKAAKRAEKLTWKKSSAMLMYVLGEGMCKKFFTETECWEWSPAPIDRMGYAKLAELKDQGLSGAEIDKTLLRLAFEKVMEQPVQYTFLWATEGLKLLFWESTRIGYVQYPAWLDRLYNAEIFKNGIRFFMSTLTMLAIFYLCIYIWRMRKNSFDEKNSNGFKIFGLSFVLIFLLVYIGIYSFFFNVPRHAFAIVPLYLVVIGFFVQNYLLNKIGAMHSYCRLKFKALA